MVFHIDAASAQLLAHARQGHGPDVAEALLDLGKSAGLGKSAAQQALRTCLNESALSAFCSGSTDRLQAVAEATCPSKRTNDAVSLSHARSSVSSVDMVRCYVQGRLGVTVTRQPGTAVVLAPITSFRSSHDQHYA